MAANRPKHAAVRPTQTGRRGNCSASLDGLSQSILALPADERPAWVLAALDFTARTPRARSYTAGILRSQLFDLLADSLDFLPNVPQFVTIDPNQLAKRLQPLAHVNDTDQVVRAVSGLLKSIAAALTRSTCQGDPA